MSGRPHLAETHEERAPIGVRGRKGPCSGFKGGAGLFEEGEEPLRQFLVVIEGTEVFPVDVVMRVAS